MPDKQCLHPITHLSNTCVLYLCICQYILYLDCMCTYLYMYMYCFVLQVEGQLPADLSGTLVLCGPGLPTLYGAKVRHPSDADGMVATLSFTAHTTAHTSGTSQSSGTAAIHGTDSRLLSNAKDMGHGLHGIADSAAVASVHGQQQLQRRMFFRNRCVRTRTFVEEQVCVRRDVVGDAVCVMFNLSEKESDCVTLR